MPRKNIKLYKKNSDQHVEKFKFTKKQKEIL